MYMNFWRLVNEAWTWYTYARVPNLESESKHSNTEGHQPTISRADG